MKKLVFILCLSFLFSCTHKKHGQIVKGNNGKFYMLEGAVPHESYFLIEIDTSTINSLINK